MSTSPLARPTPHPAPVAPTSDSRLDTVLALHDPRGVLSIYGEGAVPSRAEFIALLREFATEWSPRDRRALERRMAELERSISAPERPPGWAAFVGITSGDMVQVALPVSVDPYVVADRVPHVRPLLAAAGRAQPAGLVMLSKRKLTLFEICGVVLQELDAVDLAAHESAVRQRHGRPGAPSAPARQPGPMPDRRARRRRNRLATAAAAFADQVSRHASVRHWDLVVASGEPRLRSAFARRFPAWRTELVELTLPGVHANPALHVPHVAGEIERIRGAQLATVLAEIVQDPATIWGVEPLLAALQQGRIADVIVAEDLDAARAETVIRRALSNGAAVVPVAAGALGPLAVAGHARW